MNTCNEAPDAANERASLAERRARPSLGTHDMINLELNLVQLYVLNLVLSSTAAHVPPERLRNAFKNSSFKL